MEKLSACPTCGRHASPDGDSVCLPQALAVSDPSRVFEDILVVDPAGRILAADPGLAGWLSRKPGSGACDTLSSCFPAAVEPFWREALAEVLRCRQARHFRVDTGADGILDARLLPLPDVAGEVTAVAIRLRDAGREQHTRRQYHKLAAAVEQAVEAVIVTDERFRIEYANQAFEAMTGVSRGQARGRSLKTFYKGRQQSRKFERGAVALERGDVWSGRFLLVDAAGDTRMCDQTISPVWGKHGLVEGYAFLWRDATEVAELEKQLRHAQKMEVLGTLASGIAHDFRNILGPIILHAELCLERCPSDEPQAASLRAIVAAVGRARTLGEQLLSLGRGVESDRPVRFRLSTLVKECLKLLGPGLPAGLSIRLQVDAARSEMRADPVLVHQIVMNLLTNAVEAMREQEGGLLTVRIEDAFVGEAGTLENPSLPPGVYLRLGVSDTGHGMTSEVLRRIFEPFFTTRRAGQGTGLGLTVVRHIVSRLRGGLNVESHPGLGTSFRVLLPKGPATRTTAVTNSPDRPLPVRPEARILLVEDDPDMASCLVMALVRLGHAVQVRNSAAALATFTGSPRDCDLVLVDLCKSVQGGIGLTRELLRVRPRLPVVLLSSHDAAIADEVLSASGGAAVLGKPFCFEELDRVIRDVFCRET